MKKIFTMLLALSLISLTHSCQDEELEIQTVSVNPVEQEIIEETPFTLDEIDDVLLVNQYDNLNSLSKTILKEKLTTLYSDKVDLINWDSVRLNTDYIYIEDQTTDKKAYRFLVDIPRIDDNFIPPLVNVRVNHNIVNNDLLSDLHINDENISESLTFDLEGVVTNESSKDIVKQSARTGGSNCICVLQITGDVVSRIRWIHSSPSGNYPSGGGYSPHIASAPAAVWLQYARKTGNSQILSAFGIVHIAGVAWNNEISAKYMTPPSRTHTTNDLYIVGPDPNTFSPFTTRYFYYFPELRGLITNFYNKGWVHQIGSYYPTTSLPYNQHIRRQTFIDSFMSWSYNVQRQNDNLFQYLSNNPNAMEKIFNLFAQYHLDNRDTMLTVGYNPGANYSSNKDIRFASWLSSYLLNNNIDLIKAYVDGNISKEELESASPSLIIKSTAFKNSKAGRILNELGGSSSAYKNMIKRFDGGFPVSHLKFSIASLNSGTNALTRPPINYITEIVVNKDNLNRPDLSIARTIIHETIHAEMFRKLLSLSSNNGNIDPIKLRTMLNENNFPGIFEYYTNYGINGFQHEQMAAHYRSNMIAMLKDYKSNYPESVYEALSWVGLMNTKAWNNLSSSKKYSIGMINSRFNAGYYD